MSFMYQHWNKLLDNTKYGMKYCFGLPNLCTTMFTCHCWYNVHNKKTSKVLVFKVMQYHHPTSLYNELCCLWVIFLFTIPEIYYDDTLSAFLWGDLDHDQWSKIAHMGHQRNQWIRDQRGFLSSIDAHDGSWSS